MKRTWLLALLLTTPALAQINAGNLAPTADKPFALTKVAEFNLPWRMAFLPDGRMLITEKGGKVFLATQQGQKTEVTGVPPVQFGGRRPAGHLCRPQLRKGSRHLSHLFGAG
jgi:glucose/arabinose dehydrogenase